MFADRLQISPHQRFAAGQYHHALRVMLCYLIEQAVHFVRGQFTVGRFSQGIRIEITMRAGQVTTSGQVDRDNLQAVGRHLIQTTGSAAMSRIGRVEMKLSVLAPLQLYLIHHVRGHLGPVPLFCPGFDFLD